MMSPRDVPQRYVEITDKAITAAYDTSFDGLDYEHGVRIMLAAVLPVVEAELRARLAAEISDMHAQATRHSLDQATSESLRTRAAERANAYAIAAAAVAGTNGWDPS